MLCMYVSVGERDVMWCSSATSRLNSFFPILQAVIERTSRVASNLIRSKSTDLHSFFPPLRRLPFFIFTHFNRQGYREEPTYPRINCCSLFSLSFSFYFPVEHTHYIYYDHFYYWSQKNQMSSSIYASTIKLLY